MNRRGFLQLLAGGAATAALAKVMPAAPAIKSSYDAAPAGLQYHTVERMGDIWIEDVRCPPERIYLRTSRNFFRDEEDL